MHARTYCMLVRYACSYVMHVCTLCMLVRYACSYIMHARTLCMLVRYACSYVMRACTLCMLVHYARSYVIRARTLAHTQFLFKAVLLLDIFWPVLWECCSWIPLRKIFAFVNETQPFNPEQERERERDRQTDRQTDRQSERERKSVYLDRAVSRRERRGKKRRMYLFGGRERREESVCI